MSVLIRLPKDATSPSISDHIRTNNAPANLTGATVKFRMRDVNSTTLKIDAAATVSDLATAAVFYTWTGTDTDTEGEYRCWWRVTLASGKIQETDEFSLIIDAHAPGVGQTTGAVAERVKETIPVAYSALVNDERYGERLIQGRIDGIKYRLFATIVSPGLEATIYDRFVQDFTGKVAALSLIPAAADYWSDRVTSESATGTNEHVTYPDRIAHLWRLHERLLLEVKELEPEMDLVTRKRGKFPKVTPTGPFKSADPALFMDEFGDSLPNNLPYLPWENQAP